LSILIKAIDGGKNLIMHERVLHTPSAR